MDQETLFTASKWDILKVLSSGPKSPLELAKETRTSIANISQQLRLLELGGLVNKKRVQNRDKDLPRLLYSLAGPNSFVINISEGFVNKELVQLNSHQQFTMRSWFTKDSKRAYFLEKYFWANIEEQLDSIKAIGFRNEYNTLRVFIITEESSIKTKIKKASYKKDATKVDIEPEFYTQNKLTDIPSDDLEILYDPNNLFYKTKEVGGI